VAAGPVDVFVVEDEQDSRDVICDYLLLEGYSVADARNGESALSLLRDGLRPSLILLDLNMPVLDGWGFLREIEQQPELARVPIVFASGTGLPQSVPTRKHDAGFLKKPIDVQRLLRLVREHCGERPAR